MITGYQNKAIKRYFTKVKPIVDMHGKKAGETARIETDSAGTPLNREWRNRFKDAVTDKCIEIIKDTPKVGRPKKENINE